MDNRDREKNDARNEAYEDVFVAERLKSENLRQKHAALVKAATGLGSLSRIQGNEMKIVFFDGYCSLCNGLVDWLMKVDKTGELKFASLQGENANKLLEKNSGALDINTVIYLRDDHKYDRSTAIIMIFSDMGGIWRLARMFLIIPKYIRDLIYKLIATNRYRIFGKRNSCRIPTKQELGRLLP